MWTAFVGYMLVSIAFNDNVKMVEQCMFCKSNILLNAFVQNDVALASIVTMKQQNVEIHAQK